MYSAITLSNPHISYQTLPKDILSMGYNYCQTSKYLFQKAHKYANEVSNFDTENKL